KQTTSDELNESQQSTDTSSTTDDISSASCENKPTNQTSSEQPQVADITGTPTKSASSYNGNGQTVIKSEVQTMDSVLEEARLPIEAISPAGKRDHVRAEKRLRTYFASKKLTMPGSYVPKNRIIWKDAKDANNTSPSGSKAPPRGSRTKKVPYRPKLTEDDKTKQSIEKYWNYRIELFTKITSSSMKCLPEEEDIPSNKPEIDYVEMGLTEFVKNPFETDTHNDPEPNNHSDVASDESTEEPNTSSSSVGRTNPEAVVIEDFNNTSQTAAGSGSFGQGGCITSNKAANWNKTPFQISQPRPEEIGAAMIRIKAFLANNSFVEMKELATVNDNVTTLAENEFQNELDMESFTASLSTTTSSLFRDELDSEAPCSSVNTSILQVLGMRGESAGALSTISSPCRLHTSNSTADSLDSPSRSAILSQISPSKNDGIEAARMRMKASLATIGNLKKTVDSADNSSGNPTDTFPLFGSEVINGVPHIPSKTSTSRTTPVKESTSKKLMKKPSVTNWKKKKEVYTPPKSRFSKYFTTTKKGYKMTTQRLKNVFHRKDRNEPMQDTMPAPVMPPPTHPAPLAETCSSSSKNPTNLSPLKVETGNVKDLTKAVPQKYKIGFGPKKLALLALMKLSEERFTQKKIKSYWSVREDFRDSMTSRKVKHRKNRNDPYTVTEATPLESVPEEFDPTEIMIISPGKPASLIADNKKVLKDTAAEAQERSYRASQLLDAHLEDTLAKMKHIQMFCPVELLDFCAVGCTPTAAIEADDSNCLSTVTSSFQFNPTESDDIEGAKEPLPSPNIECDTSAFEFDTKIGQLAVPSESQADQTNSHSLEESTVVHEAYCSDSSSNNATPLQISPAKEDEIEAARIRMEAYMAKRRSLMKKTMNLTSPNSMNEVNQAQSNEVSGDVPVKAATTTIACTCKIDPKTTVADSLDKTSGDKICGQISPAKEEEINAARIRMEAYLAKKGGSMKKPIVVTASNQINRKDLAESDKPTSDSAFTVARQTESDIPNREPTSSQISPAKEDEIEAARLRMEAYLAKKGDLKTPVISIVKSDDKAPAVLTEASKDDSVLDPTASSTYSVDTTTAADTSNCSSKNDVQGQISPAKGDEIEAARIRMEAYLAKKTGSEKKVECASSDKSQPIHANVDKVAGSDNNATVDSSHNSFKNNISRQISPAKNEEIEAARIRMEAYLAKKSGLTKTNTSVTQISGNQIESATRINTPFPSATSTSDNNSVEIVPKSPVKRTRWVASLSEGTPMSSNSQKPDVNLGDTPRLTPFVIIKLSEEQKAQPQYAAYWSKRKNFYQSLTTRVIKFRKNRKEPYTKKRSFLIKSIPEEVITMIEVPISPEKSESSITSEKQLDVVNDPLAAMTPIVGCVEPVATPPMVCHMNPITTVAKSLAAPSKYTTSNQISPAKDDEIEAARKRMEAFLAKKGDLVKKPFAVTPSNNSTCAIDHVKAVGLVEPEEQSTNPLPIEQQAEVVTVTLTLATPSADKQDVSRSSVNTNALQISPAKYDEIEAARKRMEAYLAGKAKEQVNVESTSQRTREMVTSATEQATVGGKNRFQVASKQFAVKNAPNTVTPSSSAVLHQGVLLASDNTPKSEISPAKGDELAAAEERMKKFLEEKARKQATVTSGRFGVRPTLEGNLSASSAIVSTNSETSSTAEPQINVLKQISPAKASDLAAAQKRMEAFLAKKQETGSVGKKILTVSAVPLIARQAAEKTPEKPQVPKASLAEQTKRTDSVKAATSQRKEISPAKADELAEAKKRMDAFLANKQNGKLLTRTTTASSASNNLPAVQKKFIVESTKKDEQLKSVNYNPSDFKTPQKPADGEECSQPKAPFIHSQSVCSDKLMSALSDFQIEQVKNPEATRTVPETITGDYSINCFFSGVTVMVERPQLSRVESADHETPEKSQVPLEEDVIKVHYTDDFKKRISTPTKFIASQIIQKCEESPYSSPIKPEPTPEPVVNVTNVVTHAPSSVNWLEAQMAALFGRQISMATSVSVVQQVVAPVVKQTPVNLSHSICLDELTTALNEVWIKQNDEMLSRQNASMTIKEPDFLKSCVANPDCLLDKVPEYFSPVKTPCQTPVKMQFDKRIRPAAYQFSHKDVLRVRAIKLPFPKRIKKAVSFLDDFKSIPRQPTFDEVVNGGGSGFRILSIEDHNANTVTFPKYITPEGFVLKSK
ncbi:unnamed protein product, partial [Caenorhabditis brenneri]